MTRQHPCLLSGSSWDLVWLQMSYSIPSNTEHNWMSTRQLVSVSQNIFWGHHRGLGNSSKFCPGFLLLTWTLSCLGFINFQVAGKKDTPKNVPHCSGFWNYSSLVGEISDTEHRSKCGLGKAVRRQMLQLFRSCQIKVLLKTSTSNYSRFTVVVLHMLQVSLEDLVLD